MAGGVPCCWEVSGFLTLLQYAVEASGATIAAAMYRVQLYNEKNQWFAETCAIEDRAAILAVSFSVLVCFNLRFLGSEFSFLSHPLHLLLPTHILLAFWGLMG